MGIETTLLRYPQLQKDLIKIYRLLHPNKSLADRKKFAASLTSNTRICKVIGKFELQLFGRTSRLAAMGGGTDPSPCCGSQGLRSGLRSGLSFAGGTLGPLQQNVHLRVDKMLQKLKVYTKPVTDPIPGAANPNACCGSAAPKIL